MNFLNDKLKNYDTEVLLNDGGGSVKRNVEIQFLVPDAQVVVVVDQNDSD